MNKSVAIINSEAASLQDEIMRLKAENLLLQDKLSDQAEAIKLCNKTEYKRAIKLVEENKKLKKVCEEKDERIQILKSIITSDFELIRRVRKVAKPQFNEKQLRQLIKLDYTAKDLAYVIDMNYDIEEFIKYCKLRDEEKNNGQKDTEAAK
ncbi:hypothetical protein [Ruminiclostridium josui]|uniref:hypothetical protein n=1 Tax=Ruminiclostridium josui TaxID=1499 RepID=UPI0004646F6D|nr:hypothetical protein [Ruminiclostridium josui]